MTNKKINVFSEGIFSAIAKMLSFGKMRQELKKIEKMVDNDPQLQADLDNVAKANADLKRSLEVFCKRNPDHILCNEKALKEKSVVRKIR